MGQKGKARTAEVLELVGTVVASRGAPSVEDTGGWETRCLTAESEFARPRRRGKRISEECTAVWRP